MSSNAPPDAEADLLVVSDGRAIACEVKSSWASLRKSDIDDLVSLARRLRPDTAMLAIMESGKKLTGKIAEARAQLAQDQITFEMMTLATHPIDDDPYLR